MKHLARIIRYDLLVPPRDKRLGIYVNGVGTRIAPPHTPYQVHEQGSPYQWQHGRTLSDHALVFLTEGSGIFRAHGIKKIHVKAGDMLLLYPGVWHDYFPDQNTGWREYWTVFNGNNVQQILAPLGPPRKTAVLRLGIDGTICRLFNEMIETARTKPPYTNPLLSGMLLQLMAVAMGLRRLKQEGGRQEHSLVQQAKQQLETHFAEEIDIPALAASFHTSYRHFRRIFKASVGMPPHQYLLSTRILQARRLLEKKEIKIGTLAEMVGFQDPYYFSRLFKQKTGIAPALWRVRPTTALHLHK